MKFRAAILYKINHPLIIDEIESLPLKRGQVLVKISKSGICGSQLFEINGGRENQKYLPHLLGHEAYGEVIDIGPEVKKIKKSDNVLLSWIKSKGIEAEAPKFKWNKEYVNAGKLTTFSEFTICSENRCLPMDSSLTKRIGPFLGCALPTGYGLSLTLEEVKKAKFTGVIGLGGIGMSALLGILQESQSKVVAIDINDKRLEQAKLLGAHYTINPARKECLKNQISEITHNEMLDLVIECSGNAKVLQNSINLINTNGLVKFTSHPSSGALLEINPFDLILGKRIEGSWGGGVNPEEHFEKIATKIIKNKLFLNLYKDEEYRLEDVNIALDNLKNGKVLRPTINFIKE